MTYICVKCGKKWVKDGESDEVSGGLCYRCITEYVRERQKNQGFHDCFARNIEECSKECRYSECCNSILLNDK
jgi:hypothetical protein